MLDEFQVRQEKLAAIEATGVSAYPVGVERETSIAQVLASFEALEASQEAVQVVGRIMIVRLHGALAFADVREGTDKIQLVVKQDEVTPELFQLMSALLDGGDFVEAHGVAFTTKRGERSLRVQSLRVVSKALRPLPDKWHGLQDIEARFRHRELDLISNPQVRERFVIRSKFISALRRFLDDHAFLEVETPILNPIPGGANARPFVTHHNALGEDFYLRIAPELYLKRLLVGGLEKIYEIGRCFRNEGIDYSHNPEFTMIELYWAFVGKERYLSFIEEMLIHAMMQATGKASIHVGGEDVAFHGPFPRVTFREAIQNACSIDVNTIESMAQLESVVRERGLSIDFSRCEGLSECFDELYKKTARVGFIAPVWVLDYPADMKPLANVSDEDPTKSSCAQLVAGGMEVVNAYYYELNDPRVQRARLEEQQRMADAGSDIAQRMDESFLQALEHGMPGAGGMGFGIDRLMMLLTGAENIKEVILFPTLRPKFDE